jgi:CheY-like chemotaxis protein
MSMPGMGGIGFLKSILDENSKPLYPVLVLTARANMAEFFADVNVDGFIAKPCEPQDLLMEVGRIIFLRSGDELESSTASGKRSRLLFGESDAVVAKRLREWFSARDFVVELLDKGPEILERAIVSRPDIIIMNTIMEGMNGGAVAEMLKVMPNTKSIPLIMYDDSGAKLPAADSNVSGGGVLAVVSSSEPAEIHDAVTKILG